MQAHGFPALWTNINVYTSSLNKRHGHHHIDWLERSGLCRRLGEPASGIPVASCTIQRGTVVIVTDWSLIVQSPPMLVHRALHEFYRDTPQRRKRLDHYCDGTFPFSYTKCSRIQRSSAHQFSSFNIISALEDAPYPRERRDH